jgi:hypothetical protein
MVFAMDYNPTGIENAKKINHFQSSVWMQHSNLKREQTHESFQEARPLVIFLRNLYAVIHSIGISKNLMGFDVVFQKII